MIVYEHLGTQSLVLFRLVLLVVVIHSRNAIIQCSSNLASAIDIP